MNKQQLENHGADRVMKKVHITDIEGKLLYTRLWDDGSQVLPFDRGGGFVDRLDVDRQRWQIRPGWPPTRTERGQATLRQLLADRRGT